MSDDRERHSHGARQAQNVKPKPSQRERNSKEDMWRSEKAKVRRSRSTDSERAERGRRRERDRHQGERRQRGRSEEARRGDRKDGDSHRRKVKPPEDDVEETECAVCFCSYDNIFKTPKLLACGHTFCLECLARINVTSPELKTLCCPVCRELTELPHGQDLPRLGNNEDIIGKLPPDMQRALSIRFKRSKGKLLLKNPPPSSPTKSNILSLPNKSQEAQMTAGGELHLGALEQGIPPTTVVDVGRPPNRVRGRLRRLFRSDQCYYAVVASIITITVALMLVGILAFVIIPNVVVHRRPGDPANHTSPDALTPHAGP
ncbi:E3 ubiquitin-protein ligase RNF183 [Plectropomus leopardus]|uniref:E3 ubiquitin-protein ligase RNF183 n=1 Tax=Plectropomus leopardus TaxID=160734 RepID=UPI001C4B9DD2|nr:E3 ubiquitin-protein ligase RNF183 [Plectropomus leopardus]